MRTDDLPLAMLVFVAFVVMIPVWTHYIGQFAAERPADGMLASLVLPAAVLLFLTSWIRPELSGVALGGFMLVGMVLLYPWWWELTDMASGALVDDPLAQLILQLAVPALVLTFMVSLGRRRLSS